MLNACLAEDNRLCKRAEETHLSDGYLSCTYQGELLHSNILHFQGKGGFQLRIELKKLRAGCSQWTTLRLCDCMHVDCPMAGDQSLCKTTLTPHAWDLKGVKGQNGKYMLQRRKVS